MVHCVRDIVGHRWERGEVERGRRRGEGVSIQELVLYCHAHLLLLTEIIENLVSVILDSDVVLHPKEPGLATTETLLTTAAFWRG